jgi:hypothetical protein
MMKEKWKRGMVSLLQQVKTPRCEKPDESEMIGDLTIIGWVLRWRDRLLEKGKSVATVPWLANDGCCANKRQRAEVHHVNRHADRFEDLKRQATCKASKPRFSCAHFPRLHRLTMRPMVSQ